MPDTLRDRIAVEEMNDKARLLQDDDVMVRWSSELEKWHEKDTQEVWAVIAREPGFANGDLLDENNEHRAGVARVGRFVIVWEINWFHKSAEQDGDCYEPADVYTDTNIWPQLEIYSLEDYCKAVGAMMPKAVSPDLAAMAEKLEAENKKLREALEQIAQFKADLLAIGKATRDFSIVVPIRNLLDKFDIALGEMTDNPQDAFLRSEIEQREKKK